MGLIDNIFKRNDIPIWHGWLSDFRFGTKTGKYSDIYFQTIVNKIFNGLTNVRYTTDNAQLVKYADFLTNNIHEIVYRGWVHGYVLIDSEKLEIVRGWKEKLDKNGRIIVPEDLEIFYTKTYKMKGESDFSIIKENLCFIDRLAGALDYLTSTYGSVGIITGKTMPMNVQDKEELQDELKENLGITRNKNQFIISRGSDLDIKQFSFDMDKLDLEGKLQMEYLLLADYFNVPKNILSSDTDSTYENQEAALRRFYTDCITPLAEWVLEIGRGLIKNSNILVPSDELTFVFDNVEAINPDKNVFEYISSLTDIVSKTENTAIKAMLEEKIMDKIKNWQ